MVKHFFTLALAILFPQLLSSQCFSNGGIGDFEQTTLSDDFTALNQGNGSFTLNSSEKKTGSQSLQVDVTTNGTWQVRLYNNAACYFSKAVKETVVVSFYLKGTVGNVVNVSIMDNTAVDQAQDVTITSADWTLYQVPFHSATASAQGRVKLIFTKTGRYFLDDLQINAFDCHADPSGTASFDDCGICSGGNTGIAAIGSCTYYDVNPTNSKFKYEGALESDITTSKATFYRMKKSYVTTGVPIYYDQPRAAASSGVAIRFRTSSPKAKLHFQENLTLGDDVFWHTFDVFKNDTFQFSTNNFDFELANTMGKAVEWKITLPTFSVIEFLNLELLAGYSLDSIIETTKPIYVAIGNSITHGRGINSNSTRLGYPFLVADSLNYELYNWGIGGSKIYDGITTNFSNSIQPTLISILWGYNDVHIQGFPDHFTTSTFPQYKDLLATIASTYPNACILSILPTFTTNPTNTSHQTVDSLQSGQLAIIKDLQKTHPNIHYMYGSNYTDVSGLNDDVHLNEAGNSSLANGIIDHLPCSSVTTTLQPETFSSSVYPNPTTGWVFWLENQQYSLFDFSGQLLASGRNNQLDLTSYPAGLYILQLEKEKIKVLKQL